MDKLSGGNERTEERLGGNNNHKQEDGGVKGNTVGAGVGKYLAEELVRAYNEGKVVYCRFGRQYILNIEK